MKLLSSIDGLIEQLAFATNEPTLAALSSYKGLLEAFPPEVSIVMLLRHDTVIPDVAKAALQAHWTRMLKRSGRAAYKNPLLIFVSGNDTITRWIQDPFIVLVDPATRARALFNPGWSYHGTRYGHAYAAALNLKTETALVNFEGGNLLFVADVLLLGKDTLSRQPADAKTSPPVEEQLRVLCSARASLLLGGLIPRQMMPNQARSYQPFFHIDLYLSPAGLDVQGRPTLLLAELNPRFVYGKRRPPGWEMMLANIKAALEDTRVQLVEAGFVVERNPIVLHLMPNKFTVYSFNNMKVEVDGPVSRAYLPAYNPRNASPELKAILAQGHEDTTIQLSALGFEVRPVKSALLALAALSRGSLHCIAKALQRRPIDPPRTDTVSDIPASTL